MEIAVGDVHGRMKDLRTLLTRLRSEEDINLAQWVFLGDYVDGGRQSRQVIEFLRGFKDQDPSAVLLYGNHEDLFIKANLHTATEEDWRLWYNQGGRHTLESYEGAYPDILQAHVRMGMDMQWLMELPYWYETDERIYVHAGLRPGVPLQDQNPFDCLWIRDEFHQSDADFGGKRVVFGHTGFDNAPHVCYNVFGIDTHKGVRAAVFADDGVRVYHSRKEGIEYSE